MHPKQRELEKKFKQLFDEIDDLMEIRHDGKYQLHPNRLPRGRAANKEQDGLFNLGVNFTPGYGSELGRGYLVDMELSTLIRVPFAEKKELYEEVAHLVEELLPKYFPNRDLTVDKDGALYKIRGNFSLGKV